MREMSCREFIDFLDDYVAGKQADDVRAKFERHLEECPYCVDYLKTYKDTIALARKACAADPLLPADVTENDRRNASTTVLRELLGLKQFGLSPAQTALHDELIHDLCS